MQILLQVFYLSPNIEDPFLFSTFQICIASLFVEASSLRLRVHGSLLEQKAQEFSLVLDSKFPPTSSEK